MIAPNTSARRDALSIALPAGWRRIHAERLLDDMLAGIDGRSEISGVDGDKMRAATRVLSLARDTYKKDHLVLAAVRLGSNAGEIEQLTLALPDVRRPVRRTVTSDSEARADKRSETAEDVDVDGLRTISHRSLSDAASIGEGDVTGSRVQHVFVVPHSDRGAVLTLVSSVAGDEQRLEREAEEIAASVQITGTDEAEEHVAL